MHTICHVESAIVLYVFVEDIPAMLARAEALGGKRVQAKTEIPSHGWWGSLEDTEGNTIGVFSKS